MRNFNFDVSSLFGGTGNSAGGMNGFNYSDYASLKNGSYRKLLNSYYAKPKKELSANKTETDKNTNKTNTTTAKNKTAQSSAVSVMKREADGLKSAAQELGKDSLWKQNNGEYDKDKIVSAVKKFAQEYNDVIDQSSKVNSKDVTQSTYYMTSMTNTMSKALSKMGISVGVNGKMSVDEDALKKANPTVIKSMFQGSGSYGAQIAEKAGDVSKAAVMSSSMYGSDGSLSSSLSGMFNQFI